MTAGVLDAFSSCEICAAFFYLLPVILIAWFVGGISVAFISGLCGVTWFATDVVFRRIYSDFDASLWSALMALGLFLIVGYSLTTIKKLARE
jgi:hypothetical protein